MKTKLWYMLSLCLFIIGDNVSKLVYLFDDTSESWVLYKLIDLYDWCMTTSYFIQHKYHPNIELWVSEPCGD